MLLRLEIVYKKSKKTKSNTVIKSPLFERVNSVAFLVNVNNYLLIAVFLMVVSKSTHRPLCLYSFGVMPVMFTKAR